MSDEVRDHKQESRVKELEQIVENRYDKHTEIIARLEARLRAAEEVVEESRYLFEHGFHVTVDLREALRHYDKAVGRVKE